ncbi:hypothetical protein O3669_10580 [Pauljensenia sp. 20925_1_34]|uniref:hypothetical protein n=1 Tax=Pauljensenia sp. 20925_1_34 TaxID=3003674 RepID=UPI00352E5F01
MKKILIIASCLVVASLSFLAACDTHEKKGNHEVLDEKPVVYVYPEEEQGLTMTIDVKGTLDMVYPAPERQVQTEEGTRASWTISAAPDGTLTDASGRSYPYVFWEGPVRQDTPERGFIVAREDAVPFLEEKLGQLGLSDKEAADFITYWAPRIRANDYTFVSFDASSYAQQVTYSFADEAGAPVEPDTFIRVFMTIRAADANEEVTPQVFGPTPTRSGFTVVEWGGAVQ